MDASAAPKSNLPMTKRRVATESPKGRQPFAGDCTPGCADPSFFPTRSLASEARRQSGGKCLDGSNP